LNSVPEISILVGSIREDSYSLKIAAILATLLQKSGYEVQIVDPRIEKPCIPHHPDAANHSSSFAKEFQARIKKSAGVIFITPEYDGSYSAVAKVLIEYLGYPSALAGSLVSVIGVASGRIGAHRAIDHLRSVLLHIGAVVLPGQLSLAEVHKHFTDDGRPNPQLDETLSKHVTDFVSFLPSV